MDILTVGLSFVGLVLLVAGARQLVHGASRLAAAAGVPPLVVGLTIVAFGTSAPELAVSVRSAWAGRADMAVGNVVGSNVFNVLFILGASALLTPLVVAVDLVRRDVPLVIGASVLVLLLSLDGSLGRLDGALLALGLVVYTTWLVLAARRARDGGAAAAASSDDAHHTVWRDIGQVVLGLVLLVLGSTWLVDGAVAFARWLGVGEVVVSLTVVAAGTSLPEVATSLTAAARGQRDIAVGNVVGSNLFNLLGVLGVSSLVSPSGLTVADSIVGFDLPVMIAAAIACLPIWARGRTIPRWEGALLLGYFVAYDAWLVLDATRHEAREGYTAVMLGFVLPLTGVVLAFVAWLTWRRRGGTS
ncbi:MAG: calcium/sodium antiporter [Planctomycetes bacterium]|nr:calcium/sodium antiporter [Planctomycetota bacterium]